MCVIIIIYTFKHNEQIILQLTNQGIAVCVRRRSAVGRSRISSIDEYVFSGYAHYTERRSIRTFDLSENHIANILSSRNTRNARQNTSCIYYSTRVRRNAYLEGRAQIVARRSSRKDNNTFHLDIGQVNF